MEEYLVYFLKVIALQCILFGLYWFISRKTTSFQFNRYFLLSALILPFFIPLFSIPINLFEREMATDGIFDPWFFIEQSLPIVTINGSPELSGELGWWAIVLMVVYLFVAIPSILKLGYDYHRIYRLSKSSSKKEFTPLGFRLLYVPTKILSFSFLNRIFLSELFPLKSHEKKTIITHEEYHLTQKHSLDVILAEIVRIFCWFNPIILLIQKNLKETHEYLADRHTIAQYGSDDYALLLKSFKWQEINMMLGNSYSSASIKKRLNMMENSNKKSPVLQLILLSVITIFTAFLFACEDNLDSFDSKDMQLQYEITDTELQTEIDRTVDRLKKENAPHEMVEMYIREQSKYPENRYTAYVANFFDDGSGVISPEKMKARRGSSILKQEIIYSKKVGQIEIDRTKTNSFFSNELASRKGNRFAIIEKVNRLELAIYKYKMNGESGIRDDYDKEASFKGGMQALEKYLKENLDYPELAKEKGIEDKVVLRFVVTKLGGLLYLNIDKEPVTSNEEVSLEFQKAAFHAIRETAGMWSPAEKDGKYVMSKMTLPIEFRLDK